MTKERKKQKIFKKEQNMWLKWAVYLSRLHWVEAYTQAQAHIHAFTSTCTSTYMHSHSCTHTYAHACTHTNMHTCTHTHTSGSVSKVVYRPHQHSRNNILSDFTFRLSVSQTVGKWRSSGRSLASLPYLTIGQAKPDNDGENKN